ncbi:hypothetical protein ACTFIZ_001556 [Dictyostelium cf. discoideum]
MSTMKAAVLYEIGTSPKYDEFPEPKEHDDFVKVSMIASTIKQLDRGRVSGKHYMKYTKFPTAVGIDGVGRLEDGQLVYCFGDGMIAEKSLVEKGKYAPLSNEVDPYIAAALPNTLLGSDMALLFRAEIKKGDVVLVNGATGVTGSVAVQIAKIRGASKVIAAGRNEEALKKLQNAHYGVDEILVLNSEEGVAAQMKQILDKQPIDIVLDYLWGQPTEMIIKAIVAQKQYHVTKIVSVGEMAGSSINLPSAALRSTAISILGSGLGSFPVTQMHSYFKEHLNELLLLAKQGKLKVDIKIIDLKDIEKEWLVNEKSVRTVVKIN